METQKRKMKIYYFSVILSWTDSIGSRGLDILLPNIFFPFFDEKKLKRFCFMNIYILKVTLISIVNITQITYTYKKEKSPYFYAGALRMDRV